MDANIDIEANGAPPLDTTEVRLSEVYDTVYDGPKVRMIKDCKFCTTPLRYFINNLKGSEMLMLIAIMMCGPVGAHLLFTIYLPFRVENPLALTLSSGPAVWIACYALGSTTGGFLLFGEAMEILRYADAAFWKMYYSKKEATMAETADITDQTPSAPADESSPKDVKPFYMKGMLIRMLFKFRTNNVMQDGEFLPLTPWQWFKRATWMERICHIFFSLRWLAASVILLFAFTYNYTVFFMNIQLNILMNDAYLRMLQFINGMTHIAMVCMGWKIAVFLLELWRKSRTQTTNFLSLFHHIPDGCRYIPDPKFAFIMDACPCSYVVPEALALPPEYEQTTHFHSYYAHIFKTIFVCVAGIVIIISAAHSLAAGITVFVYVNFKTRQILEQLLKDAKEAKPAEIPA